MSVADATGSGDTAPPLSSSNGATAGPATPAHNKEMATRFLVGLIPMRPNLRSNFLVMAPQGTRKLSMALSMKFGQKY